jgi:pimeloyl-ACP methyl ester carboxylesterase
VPKELNTQLLHQSVRLHGEPPYAAALLHGGPGAAGSLSILAEKLALKSGILEPLQTKLHIAGLLTELDSQLSIAKHPLTLIGHSWGAWLAVLFAAKNPEKIRQLVLISAGPFEEAYAEKIQPARMQRLSAGEKESALLFIRKFASQKGAVSAEEFTRFGILMEKADSVALLPEENPYLDFQPAQFYSVWKEADFLRKKGRLLDALDEIRCPVHAIHGMQDSHPYAGVEIPLRQHLSEVDFVLLDHCGHYPWRERFAHEEFFQWMTGLW